MTGKKKEAEKEYKGWGGKREGSGRKQIGPPKKKVTFYISDDEKEAVKTFLERRRNGKHEE